MDLEIKNHYIFGVYRILVTYGLHRKEHIHIHKVVAERILCDKGGEGLVANKVPLTEYCFKVQQY